MLISLDPSAARQVLNTPYLEDPESGLWYNPDQVFHAPTLVTVAPEEMAACDNLAQALWVNWMKQVPGHTLEIVASNNALGRGLHARTGKLASTNPRWDSKSLMRYRLITCVHGFQRLPVDHASCALQAWWESLDEEGTLFIRMPDKKVKGFERDLTDEHFKTSACFWDLDSFLWLLDQEPLFKIAETYEIHPGQRDYLLKAIPHKPRVCIGMIAKNEARDLPRCLKSLEGVADGLVLVDTGSRDDTQEIGAAWAKSQGDDFVFHGEQYLDASEQDESGDWKLWDFGKARNRFVEKIEALGFDYVLWMDADDELRSHKKLRRLCYLDQYGVQAVQMHSGDLRWPHHRLWKTGKGVRFQGRCHEYPNYGGLVEIYQQDVEIYHDAAPGEHESSNARNLRILKREFEENPTPRCAFYLGNTYKDAGRWEEAIPAYQKRIEFGLGFADEYWFAVLYLARCLRQAQRVDAARETLLNAVQAHPDWAEFWMELSYLEDSQGNTEKCLEYALRAKDLPVAPTQLFRERNAYTDQPYRMISWSHEKLGHSQEALKAARTALTHIGGPDQDWEERIARLARLEGTYSAQQICLYRPGALGDIIMTLNLIPAFRARHPGKELLYRCAPSIRDILEPLILQAGVDRVVTEDPGCEMIPLIGYPMQEGYPNKPMKRHLLEYFADEMKVPVDFNAFRLPLPTRPNIQGRYVTIHPKAGWSPYKNWKLEGWAEICARLRAQGIGTYQIGHPNDQVIPGVSSELMREGFDYCLAGLAHATLHLGVDSWSNHATNIQWEGKGRTPGVILWGSTQASAAGYSHNQNVSLNLPCQPCFREDPKISAVPKGVCPLPAGQSYENPQHLCMGHLSVEVVGTHVEHAWNKALGRG